MPTGKVIIFRAGNLTDIANQLVNCMKDRVDIVDKRFIPYLDSKQIQDRVKEVAEEIQRIKFSSPPILVCVLGGSVRFFSDLLKYLDDMEVEIAFTKVSSYQGLVSKGLKCELELDPEKINGREIIVVEDIIDSGKTITYLLHVLNGLDPKSVRVCTLLYKPGHAACKVLPDFIGFTMRCSSTETGFVVGYGLDYNELGRNLNSIYRYEQDI